MTGTIPMGEISGPFPWLQVVMSCVFYCGLHNLVNKFWRTPLRDFLTDPV